MTTAREIMHAGAQCIGEHASLSEAARMMRDLNVGSLPICGDDKKLKGIITDRDLVIKCLAEDRDAATMTAADLAQGKPMCIQDDADVNDVLRVMEQHQIRRLPVIASADHQLVGMISEADLVRSLPQQQVAEFVGALYTA